MIKARLFFEGRFATDAPALGDSRVTRVTVGAAVVDWLEKRAFADLRVCVIGVRVRLERRPRRGFVHFRAVATVKAWTEKGTVDRLLPEVLALTLFSEGLAAERRVIKMRDSGREEGRLKLARTWARRFRWRKAEENRRIVE